MQQIKPKDSCLLVLICLVSAVVSLSIFNAAHYVVNYLSVGG